MRSILVALALVAILPISVAAEPRGEAAVELDHTQGTTMNGAVTGQLEVHRILFPRSLPPIQVHATDAEFLRVATHVNMTRVGNTTLRNDYEPIEQELAWHHVSGRLDLRWPEPDAYSLLLASGPDYLDDGIATTSLSIHANGAAVNGVSSDRGPSPYGVDYWQPGDPRIVQGGVGAPHRWVTLIDPEPARLDGPFVLHLRQAQVALDSEAVWDREPYGRTVTTLGTPTGEVRRTTTTFIDGYLFVHQGSVSLPLAGARLSTGDAEWQVAGDAVFNGATGRYDVGGFNGTFRDETLGLSGTFDLSERVAHDRPTHGTATGTFSVIAVDYIVRAGQPTGMSLIEQAFWITIFAGGAAFIVWLLQHAWAFLYTRVAPDAVLEHPRRAEIMEFVSANPGCHIERLASDLQLARGVARHHLMVLERAGRVRRFHDGGQTLLVPAGQTKHVALRAAALEDPRLAEIHDLVTAQPIRRAELVAMLTNRHGVAGTTARRWIDKAVRMGLVEAEGSGHGVQYRGPT